MTCLLIMTGLMDTVKMLHPGLSHDLPQNINLLTLEPWHLAGGVSTTGSRFYLVRLEHIFQVGENQAWAQETEVDIGATLSTLGNYQSRATIHFRAILSMHVVNLLP